MTAVIVVNLVLLVIACWLVWWRDQVKKLKANVRSVEDAYFRGDFDDALRLVEKLKPRKPVPSLYYLLRGQVQYQLGDLPEAEKTLQAGLAIETESRRKALYREALGRVLTESKRYDEAIACLEAAADDCVDLGTNHRALAEVYLRQGNRSADALGSARLGVKLAHAARGPNKHLLELNLSEAEGTLAWAVASQTGDPAEVDRLLADAFLRCGHEYRPTRAHLHCLAAGAYLALGTADARAKSADHWSLASATDPFGNFGRRARSGRETTV